VNEQTLFPSPPKLTGRQQSVLDLLTHNPSGLTDYDVGMHLRRLRGLIGESDWATRDGRSVLYALRRKRLVVRRKTGLWQLLAPAEREKPRVESPLDRAEGIPW
jgi:hypothetical protein